MKKKICALICAMAFTMTVPGVFASSGGLGTEFAAVTQTLCDGLVYREIHATNAAGNQIGYSYTFTPGKDAALSISYGQSIYGRETVSAMLERAQKNGNNVVGAINGDVFAVQSGLSLSAMISEGTILATNDSFNTCIGIKKDGSVISGIPEISVTVTAGGKTLKIDSYNKKPEESGSYLLSTEFASSTKSTVPGTEVMIKPTSNQATVSGVPINGTVCAVYTSSSDRPIPSGCYALSVPASHEYAPILASLSEGTVVTFTVTASGEWADADFAIGTDKQILSAGVIQNSSFTSQKENAPNARSAVGFTDDGKLVFFAADADGKYGKGLTLQETAAEMRALGCSSAFTLDSYSSTTAAVKLPGQSAAAVVSHPSAGSEREISNCILFLNTGNDRETDHLEISPANPYVITGGGSVTLSCFAATPSGTRTEDALANLSFSLSKPLGTLSGSRFISGSESGSVTITATADVAGKSLTGSTTLTVIPAIDSYAASSNEFQVCAGGTVKLDITGYRTSIPVAMCASKFSWSFIGTEAQFPEGDAIAKCAYGYLDNDLIFHADPAYTSGSFTLRSQYGYQAMTFQITIGKASRVLTSFDDNTQMLSTIFDLNPLSFYRYTDGKFLTSALQFKGKQLAYTAPPAIGEDAQAIKAWIKGTCTNPYLQLRDKSGNLVKVFYQKEKDYTAYNGWNLYRADIPVSLSGEKYIARVLCSDTEMDCTVDEITVYYDTATNPFCDISGSWAKEEIETLYEADIVNGVRAEGKYYYYPKDTLNRAEFAKLIVAYHKIDLSLYEQYPLDFNDAYQIPNWAKPYIRAAVGSGLMIGSANPDGTVDFLPKSPITRAEIMTVIGRGLEIEETEISFTDNADIPRFALSGVRKTVAAQIINGYPDGSLRPNDNITREETARVLYTLYCYEYE